MLGRGAEAAAAAGREAAAAAAATVMSGSKEPSLCREELGLFETRKVSVSGGR